jgi:predicted dehydrogenase
MERYGTVFQAGTQRRNLPHFEYAVGLARSGALGVLQEVHAHDWGRVETPLGHSWWPNDEELPDPRVFSFDDWLGPTPWRPYNSQYMDRGRSQFWDWHGGILEWASHTVDLCQFANGDDMVAVEHELIPGTTTVESRYPNGVKLVSRGEGWLDSGSCAVRFIGTEGWVETGDNGVMFFSENLEHLNTVQGPRGTDPTLHIKNLLDCVRSRSKTRANASATANAHITSHGQYVAAQLKRKVYYDPEKREFINDEEANRLISRAYREPYRNFAYAWNM